MSLLLALTGSTPTGVTGTLAWTSEGETWAIASNVRVSGDIAIQSGNDVWAIDSTVTAGTINSTLAWTSQNEVWVLVGNVPQESTLGGVPKEEEKRYAPYAPWSLTKGLTPELREQIRMQLLAESEPVKEVITAQARTKFESMEAEEKALQAAILAAKLEYDALYMRLLSYQREQMEEEAVVMTMMALM